MLEVFRNNDRAYQAWLDRSPDGYVLNSRSNITPDYLVLHRSNCYHISQYNEMSKPGGFTERSYIKVCSEGLEEIKAWLRSHAGPDSSFSKVCQKCLADIDTDDD